MDEGGGSRIRSRSIAVGVRARLDGFPNAASVGPKRPPRFVGVVLHLTSESGCIPYQMWSVCCHHFVETLATRTFNPVQALHSTTISCYTGCQSLAFIVTPFRIRPALRGSFAFDRVAVVASAGMRHFPSGWCRKVPADAVSPS
jgi:hypothetical protein